ncbi:unnamed protein product [Paramecium sonneborni]|uniref:Splicing factor 3B subunit 4 n=1 Tax=Paramecium sonneborni TaxID=65129 RepID=A0A8S1M1H8_9CILI|nr:unnamed protein product [Paramecium sonneborni]
MSLALAGVVPPLYERNQEATIYIGNLDQKVTDDIVWELFIQCGPVVNVHIPKDKISGEHQGYGFVEFKSEEDADYAIKIMHMIKLYGKPIKVNKASQDKRTQEVGANLFIGNLDTEIDEKTLYETFSAFGHILSTKIMRNPETGVSKGYGFVSYDNFESSDGALTAMNGQFLGTKIIRVEYAFKKDAKGERHGSQAERLLAANRPLAQKALLGFVGYMPTELRIPLPPPPSIQIQPLQEGYKPFPQQIPVPPLPPPGIPK